MSSATNMNIYLNNHYEGMTPEKLIEMLYKGALRNLKIAKEGINENNPKKKGEHLSKAIAIVSELYSSLDPEMNDESTRFLRGLYYNILVELPKISITNDIKILDLACSYIEKLDQIWEHEVMGKNHEKQPAKPKSIRYEIDKKTEDLSKTKNKNNGGKPEYGGYGRIGQKMKIQSLFA